MIVLIALVQNQDTSGSGQGRDSSPETPLKLASKIPLLYNVLSHGLPFPHGATKTKMETSRELAYSHFPDRREVMKYDPLTG